MRKGRGKLFGPINGTERVQGLLTQGGSSTFEWVRENVRKAMGWKAVSDGDVIDYLARFYAETRANERKRVRAVLLAEIKNGRG